MRTTIGPWLRAAAVALLAGCGPKQQPAQGPPPLCSLDTGHGADAGTHDAGPQVRWGRPEEWMSFLVHGFDRTTMQAPDPAQDCTGSTVQWHEPDSNCSEPVNNGTLLPPRALTEDDLVISRVDAHHKLVWLALEHYDNGEAVGPVVYAEVTRDKVNVFVSGMLRAMPRRARLHVEDAGTGTKVLVAEGDYCARPDDPTTCRRNVRLMLCRGDHFEPLSITRVDGTCVSPARFAMVRDATAVLPNGWSRRFELATSLTYGTSGITEHESVVVRDSDPRLPAVPPRIFRRADADRLITIEDTRLVTDDLSLWSRVMNDEASVAGGAMTDAGQ